jgi:DNA polymerase I-like protein with 3'-5' exonuclease and polymerase domains
MASPKLLFLGTEEDRSYLPRLKPLVGTASVSLNLSPISTWTEIQLYCSKKQITGILSTSRKLLEILTQDSKASIDNYAGSYFSRNGIEIVFLHPLAQLVSVPYGPFLAARYCSKLCFPENWKQWPEFSWMLASEVNIESVYTEFSTAQLLAVDIETTRVNLAITSISYTGVFSNESGITLKTIVFELDSSFSLAWVRKFNQLPAPKIFQNGKYDNSYLLRYNAPCTNWFFDTAAAFHCWYSELPKDLGSLSAFFYKKGRFWKDMADGDSRQKLEYNGRDTFNTAIVMLEWLLQAPAWAKTNYLQEFPLVFPCLLSEMTGIKRDMNELELASTEANTRITEKSTSLDKMLGVSGFNVNSPKQMKQLLCVLGCRDIAAESTDEKHLTKAQFRHPLINRILDVVLEIRGDRKLISTYITPGKEFHERILYSLNPHGTDTGRLASKEHHFWCGLQIQNIPRGPAVKRTLIADKEFRLFEADLEQAESRDTAYIAGDESLIEAVTGVRDFHSVNASAFFGIPYDKIYDSTLHKVLDKILRDLAKRVNHGANYNMGPNVLVETMGLKNIYKAMSLLGLPKYWQPKQVAEYLLSCFHKTYPALQKIYYTGVVHEIKTTRMLQSRATHDSDFNVAGWTRYCFSDPEKDKRALNSYIAHSPQSLNAMTLNKAFMKVFYELAINKDTRKNFRLLAQIHDSILFQLRCGHESIAARVKSYMEIPVTVKGYDNKIRVFTVPAALKAGKDGAGAIRWSETE